MRNEKGQMRKSDISPLTATLEQEKWLSPRGMRNEKDHLISPPPPPTATLGCEGAGPYGVVASGF